MFEPTCRWFVKLNTIVLNIKKHRILHKKLRQHAKQANSVFVKPVLNRNFVIFPIDWDVWGLTEFSQKIVNWQGTIYKISRLLSQAEGVTRIYRVHHSSCIHFPALAYKFRSDISMMSFLKSNEILTIIYRSSIIFCQWQW